MILKRHRCLPGDLVLHGAHLAHAEFDSGPFASEEDRIEARGEIRRRYRSAQPNR
jgi:hypothetical protein